MKDCQQSLQYNDQEANRNEKEFEHTNNELVHSNEDADENEALENENANRQSSEEDRDFVAELYHGSGESDDDSSLLNSSFDELDGENDQGIDEVDHESDQSIDEADSDEDEDDTGNRKFDEPLYSNAPLTKHESMILMLCFFLKHNISQTCLSDLVLLINLHCMPLNMYKNSLFKFKKYFSLSKASPILKHYYCTWCHKKLEHLNDTCTSCFRRHKKNVSFFVEVDFISQLKEMFKRPNFYENLQYRFKLQHGSNEITDIYDSNLYKSWFSKWVS